MSVIVRGMEMPTSCRECHFGHGDSGVCVVDFKQHGDWDEPHDCPLAPVPKHGDLIDRGYAIATACSGRIRTLPTTEDGENWIRVEEVRESIKDAPTIIPAEETLKEATND